MNNYIDLIGQITERLDVPCGNIRLGIHEALAYLDDHPELTGRTITESELRRIAEDSAGPGASTVMPYIKATVEALSITIIPDPEETNAERLRAVLDVIGNGRGITNDHVAQWLDEAGVKAGGNND